MKQLGALHDPVYPAYVSFNPFEKFCLRFINDKRDLPFIRLLLWIHLLVIPAGILLFFPVFTGVWWWVVYVLWFFIGHVKLRGPFGLMLHNITHRRLFKRKYQWLNKYVTWFVCPFFGHTPETYFVHHVAMHHEENNMDDDTSSTLRYQRDSLLDFIKYYLNFIFLGFKETFMYLFNKKKKKYYMKLTYGEGTFFVLCVVMCFINLQAALFILIIPFLLSRLVMMLGNWTQHAFVDPDCPENMYRNCYTCINTSYNKKCWNDGYHLIHHLKPGAHYTDMPALFVKEKEQLVKQKSLVFDGIHYLHLFFYLMTKRYDKIADNLVNINNSFSSKDDVIRILKQRTAKFYNRKAS